MLTSMLRRELLIGAVLIGLASACGNDGSASASSATAPTIVATTPIWADVVSNVVCGDQARVETLVPAGGDSHVFEPSLADRARLDDASLIVMNGLGLEGGLIDTIEASSSTTIALGEVVGESIGDELADPHIWFDPQLVKATLEPIAAALLDSEGVDPEGIESCVDDYSAELDAVDIRVAELVAELPVDRRLLVADHDALGYFADRYGFELVGAVRPSSGLAQTSPAHLEDLAQRIETAGVRAIFAENGHSLDDVHALADRVDDIDIVTIDVETLGRSEDGSPGYVEWLESTAETIVEALS